MQKFTNKKGQLTNYALNCGYIQTFEARGKRIVLSKEHLCYHVKNTSNENRYWVSFDTLNEARLAFRIQVQKVLQLMKNK